MKPAAKRSPSLPRELTPLYGRAEDLAAAQGRLESAPVLSVTGLGGIGKTRFALRLAHDWNAGGERPVAWVELAALQLVSQVAPAICAALGTQLHPGQDPLDTAAEQLSAEAALLVLDNCEHLLDGCSELVAELTARIPNVHILTTSREALGVPGESVWKLGPLDVSTDAAGGQAGPGQPPGPMLDHTLDTPAIRLFVERAQQVEKEFAVSGDRIAQVVRICQALDGIPLAIELAAAQAGVLGLDQIETRLLAGIGGLGNRRRAVPDRHASMRAAIEGSEATLEPAARALFVGLGVFRGSFSLGAVVDVMGMEEPEAIGEFAELTRKSLIATSQDEGSARYRLLQPVAQFAEARLGTLANRSEIRARHRSYYARAAASLLPALKGSARSEALVAMSRDQGNYNAAWRTAIDDGDRDFFEQAAEPCFWMWNFSCRLGEGRQLCELALDEGEWSRDPPCQLLHAAGALSWIQGDLDGAQALLEQSATTAEQAGNQRVHGLALRELGALCLGLEQVDLAYQSLGVAVQALEGPGSEWDRALAGTLLADVESVRGNPARARKLRLAARRSFETLGDPWGLALCLFGLSLGAAQAAEWSEAYEFASAALVLQERDGDAWNRAQCACLLGDIELARGDTGASARAFTRSVEELARVGDQMIFAYVLERLAVVAHEEGRPERATTLLAASGALRRSEDNRYPYALGTLAERERLSADLQAALGVAAYASAQSAGLALDVESARALVAGTKSAGTPVEGAGPALRILALGATAVWRDDHRLGASDWTYALPRELLFYLLLNGPCAKEAVGLALWPDASSAQLRGRFRTTLYQLRQALGHVDWVRYRDGKYGLATSNALAFDVADFERAAEAGVPSGKGATASTEDLVEAATLYRGDLLEDERFGDWVIPHRVRLRARFCEVALALGATHRPPEVLGNTITALRQAAALEPLDERVARGLAECLLRSGDRGAALKALDTVARSLEEELDAAPDAATQQLRQRIAAGRS